MDNISTIFFQGNQAARLQATKYCGKEGLNVYVSNGQTERVFNPDSPKLLYNLFHYQELNDIEYGWSWNPFHWLFMLLHWIRQWQFNIYGTACVPHNKWSLVNISGGEDITQCLLAIKACIKANPTRPLVLFGTSRGAATVISSLTRLSKEELTHVAMVIAEAPFATVPSVLYEIMPWASRTVPALLWLLQYFTQYREGQPSPLEAVAHDDFPLDTPLVFVTSATDRTVPLANTMQLVTVLEGRCHRALHHIALKHSHHTSMSLGNAEDRQVYETELHTLYRKYLPQPV